MTCLNYQAVEHFIIEKSLQVWGWPVLALLVGVGVVTTFALKFVQVRYFFTSWRLLLRPADGEQKNVEITPFQAFWGSLGEMVGNMHITGVAVAITLGGPGAAFWILIADFFGMAIRFSEVYVATWVTGRHSFRGVTGGPMVYLSLVPGGHFLPHVFASLALFYALAGSTAAQANCIGNSIVRTWHVEPLYVALALFAFLVYAVLGGAKRFLHISDRLTPFKLVVFFASSIAVIAYHWNAIIPAIVLIFKGAFVPSAIAGGAAGFTVQQAMRNGFARALNANEAGLGTAALFFGSTEGKKPVQDALMSMAGIFSSFLVCFSVALVLITSGVWNNGEPGSCMVVSAFETLFGQYGGWVTSFIAASLGLGVMVSAFFIARKTWMFLTNNRLSWLFSALVCIIAFCGVMVPADVVFSSLDLVMIALFFINLYGVLWQLPAIMRGLREYCCHKEVEQHP